MSKIKGRFLIQNETIEIGDIICAKFALNLWQRKVHRVTKTMALVRYNEISEGKFPRIYGSCFYPKPRQNYNMVKYTVYRPDEVSDG